MDYKERINYFSDQPDSYYEGDYEARPNNIAINNALKTGKLLYDKNLFPDFIYPAPDGGVNLDFYSKAESKTIVIVCNNDGTIDLAMLKDHNCLINNVINNLEAGIEQVANFLKAMPTQL